MKPLTFIIALLSLATFVNICPAQNNETNLQLSLQEINFKNSEQDYLTFEINSKNDSTIINLKGLTFYDDQNFKTIKTDYLVKNHSLIKLIFNSNQTDNPDKLELFTTKKGLTGTSEQILISQEKFPLDFFCWQKTPISKAELSDFAKILPKNIWPTLTIEQCFNSDLVKTNQSITTSTSKQISDWKLIDLQKHTQTKLTSKSKNSAFKSKKLSQSSFDKAIKSQLDQDFPDSLNPKVVINEIFPAPASGNKNQEWIEIQNISNQEVDLSNWYLDDQPKGSKPFKLPAQKLLVNQVAIVPANLSKISLSNTQDQVRLFNANLKLEHQVKYQEASKNQSYQRQILIDQDGAEQIKWQWSSLISPGKINPIFHQIEGEIITDADFSHNQYFFQFQSQEGPNYYVLFDENLIKAPQAKALFLKNTKVSLSGQVIENKSIEGQPNLAYKILKLNQYQVLQTPEKVTNNFWPFLLIMFIFSISTGLYLVHQKFQKTHARPLPY